MPPSVPSAWASFGAVLGVDLDGHLTQVSLGATAALVLVGAAWAAYRGTYDSKANLRTIGAVAALAGLAAVVAVVVSGAAGWPFWAALAVVAATGVAALGGIETVRLRRAGDAPAAVTRAGEIADDGAGRAAAGAAPTVTIAALGGLVVSALALVGVVDLDELTRGAPWATFLGACCLLISVGLGGAALAAQREAGEAEKQREETRQAAGDRARDVRQARGAVGRVRAGLATALLVVGLGCYVFGGVRVTSDPPAPQITAAYDASGALRIEAAGSRLAFDERLDVRARAAGRELAVVKTGPDRDGRARIDLRISVPPRTTRLNWSPRSSTTPLGLVVFWSPEANGSGHGHSD